MVKMDFNNKKKRKSPRFPEFRELDRYMKSLMEELMEDFSEHEEMFKSLGEGKPFKMHFSVKMNPGAPKRKFKKFKDKRKKSKKKKQKELMDVRHDDKRVFVTLELSGVKKENLRVEPNENSVWVKVKGEKPYTKKIELGEKVKPESLSTEFKNNILEIELKKA